MDINTYSKHLAAFVAFAMSGKKTDRAVAVDALREINGDRGAAQAFAIFCEDAGIEVMTNATYTVMSVFPSSGASPFAHDASEIRKMSVGGERPDLTGFAMLCVLGAFYPSRNALNTGVRQEVTVENVIGMIDKMIAFADTRRELYGEEDVVLLADKFRVLSDDVASNQKDKGQKATYVLKALDNLVKGDFVKEMDGGRYFLPTDALRMLAVERLSTVKTKLGGILSDFLDEAEMSIGDE
jgi:hypothetical protein